MEELLELFDYGVVMRIDELVERAGKHLHTDEELSEMSVRGIRRALEEDSLVQLHILDWLRNKLLDRGMYLKQQSNSVRVLLPSENMEQVGKYFDGGMKKFRRAERLLATTSRSPDGMHSSLATRIARARKRRDDFDNRV
jgi:hypothetical protein